MLKREEIFYTLDEKAKSSQCDLYNCKALGDGVKNHNYIEYAAEWFLGRDRLNKIDDELNDASKKFRKKSYNVNHPIEATTKAKFKYRIGMCEDHMARYFVGYTFPYMGQAIDYQTPLKDDGEGRRGCCPYAKGKIDLITQSDENIFLLEFKRNGPHRDSLLHAAIEIYSYYSLLNHAKFKRDFSHRITNPNAKITPALLIFDEGKQSDELAYAPQQKFLPELLNELSQRIGLEIITIDHTIIEHIANYEVGKEPFPALRAVQNHECEPLKIKVTNILLSPA